MNRSLIRILMALAAALVLAGCATVKPKDYTEFRRSRPRSILVLPPVNQSTDVGATYSVLTTTTHPLAELGYYVLPVAMVDEMLRQNGLTVPADMQAVPVAKLREVFGADAVLYITVEKYGTKYQLIQSNNVVSAQARLVDCRSGVDLWEGKVSVAINSGNSGLLEALVDQVVNKLTDEAHVAAQMASWQLLTPPGQGLLKGPHHPEYGKD